jgi:hypothetical protein
VRLFQVKRRLKPHPDTVAGEISPFIVGDSLVPDCLIAKCLENCEEGQRISHRARVINANDFNISVLHMVAVKYPNF